MAQRDTALEWANCIRYRRADFKMEVTRLGRAQGCALLADAVEEMPDWLAGADALVVIGWAPRVGVDLGDDIYARSGARSLLRLRELSPRQRGVIAGLLREHGGCRGAKVAA